MGLRDLVRAGVAVANTLTADLQATVVREAYIGGQDTRGEPNRSAGVNVSAIVEYKVQMVRTGGGNFVASRAKVTSLDPAIVFHPKDKLTLPDGTSGPILETDGLADRVTTTPFLTEVYVGTYQ